MAALSQLHSQIAGVLSRRDHVRIKSLIQNQNFHKTSNLGAICCFTKWSNLLKDRKERKERQENCLIRNDCALQLRSESGPGHRFMPLAFLASLAVRR